MANNDELDDIQAALALNPPGTSGNLNSKAPKVNPVFTGDFTHTGSKFGVNGATPVARAAAITAPTAPSAAYVQAEATSMRTAVNAVIAAIKNAGITL